MVSATVEEETASPVLCSNRSLYRTAGIDLQFTVYASLIGSYWLKGDTGYELPRNALCLRREGRLVKKISRISVFENLKTLVCRYTHKHKDTDSSTCYVFRLRNELDCFEGRQTPLFLQVLI